MTARTTTQRPGTPIWRDFWTTDGEGTAQFFRQLFSAEVGSGSIAMDVPVGDPDMGGYTTAQLDGRHVFGIGPALPSGGDVAAVFLATDDADATHAKALELGATEEIPPTTVEGHGRFSAVVDPTGALVAFYESHGMLGYGAVDELGFPCWQDLLTTDPQAAQRFYGELFGFDWNTDMPGYLTAQFGDDGILGIGRAENDSHWVQYTLVDDLDATVAKAQELGAALQGEPMDLGFGRSAHLATPAGAAFGLFEGSEEMQAQMEAGQ